MPGLSRTYCRWKGALRALLGGLLLFSSDPGFGNDIFEYQGPYTHLTGGAGIIMGRSGEAVLHNPANLWNNAATDTYVDFAPTNLTYKVTTPAPNLKPGVIKVPVLPLTSVGGSVKGETGPLSFGYMFIPTGFGTEVKVKDFPIALDGNYQAATITNVQKGFKLGIGSAFKFSPTLSVGFSIINNYSSSINKISSGGEDLIELQNSSSSLHLGLGVRYQLADFGTVAAIFRPSTDMHYSLKVKPAGSSSQSFYRRDYRPTLYGVGVHLRSYFGFQPYGQYAYERWTPATLYAQNPAQAVSGVEPVQYLNTHNFVLGTRYFLRAGRHLTFAYSHFTKNKGSGIKDATGKVAMQGRAAQDFEGLDRTHLTGGYEMNTKSADLLFYGSFIRGSATSPEDTPSAGYYEMTAILLGIGYISKY